MGMSGDFEQAVSSAVGAACSCSWPASTAISIMQHQANRLKVSGLWFIDCLPHPTCSNSQAQGYVYKHDAVCVLPGPH